MEKRTTRGQEEIVGFVAVVVIVAVIGVVLLSLSLKEPQVDKESRDIRRFLESAMEYTSDCALNYEPNYADIRDLLKACYESKSRKCINNNEICSELNETLSRILDASWPAGEENVIKGYIFNANYAMNASKENEIILEISKGNCSQNYIAADNFFSAYPGVISSSLKVCY